MLQKPTRPAQRSTLKATKDDWLNAALAILIREGIEAVLVLPRAKKLKVSRSSFYWYFKNRKDLLDHLLQHRKNSRAGLDRCGGGANHLRAQHVRADA